MAKAVITPENPYYGRTIEHIEDRYKAISELVLFEDDRPYREWLESTGPGRNIDARVADVRTMIDAIRRGIEPQDLPVSAWVEQGKPVGEPPCFEVYDNGNLWTWDGGHRSCIRVLLGLPLSGHVVKVAPAFEPALARRTLYQRHPHPCLDGWKHWRDTHDRYRAVAAALRACGVQSVYELGCAEGVGLWELQRTMKVGGAEKELSSRLLASSLVRVPIDSEVKFDGPRPDADALVALSVLYHCCYSEESERQAMDWVAGFKHAVVELATDDVGPWTPYLRTFASPRDRLLTQLVDRWPNRVKVFVDRGYHDRETWLFWR